MSYFAEKIVFLGDINIKNDELKSSKSKWKIFFIFFYKLLIHYFPTGSNPGTTQISAREAGWWIGGFQLGARVQALFLQSGQILRPGAHVRGGGGLSIES